ncbi:MAG: SMC-Scp complex subunit ScpB [Gemmatales bacterium]|nr:SMC-Scp complex subunit ScpB [Gemmatales bacterium]MDW8174952.1 SMC-Scp complex subunit ScpB [Gemmatales bacterium]
MNGKTDSDQVTGSEHSAAQLSSQPSNLEGTALLPPMRHDADFRATSPGEASCAEASCICGTAPASGEVAPPSLERIIEAITFVEGRPLSARRVQEIIPDVTEQQFQQIIQQLQRRYRQQGRPYAFMRQADGYLLTLRPQFRRIVEGLYGETKETALSLAAIEVLAIVAYKQPVSRSTIDALRGRDSTAVIRQLLRRGLIAVQSNRAPVTSAPPTSPSVPLDLTSPHAQSVTASAQGEAALENPSLAHATERAASSRRPRGELYYVTTARFLTLFGLRDLNDLPRSDELEIL